jgi:ACS family hexuronate transporter-like MFS transporter
MSNNSKMTNWRWVLCALLFAATTVNYMDRQVLSLTYNDFIAPEFHWTNRDYGIITGFFSIFYAVACLFAGKFVDWMGTKKGYLWAIFIWSLGACLHAGCGWVTEQLLPMEFIKSLIAGWQSILEFFGVEVDHVDWNTVDLTVVHSIKDMAAVTGAVATAVAAIGVWLFLVCRAILALGEAGNFPAAIKVTAEYFPKKDRAFATSIFNAGASVGALVAPLTIPFLAEAWGWEMAFIIIGALGFIWMFFWHACYDKPEASKRVNEEELKYIHQDDAAEAATATQAAAAPVEEKSISLKDCFKYRQTWSFIAGKFFTDGVWWFFLFWAPTYFSVQFGYKSSSTMGSLLIFVLYLIVTVLSIFGGYLPKLFVEKKGMEPYDGRMRAMLIFAFFPVCALFAQPLGSYSAWWPAIIIGLAGAGHQAWSANLFSTIGDMFPKSTIATITGIGAMAGGIGSFLINIGAGSLFTYAAGTTQVLNADGTTKIEEMTKELLESGHQYIQQPMEFLGFVGKPAGYMLVFCICAVAYLIAWSIMKILVPKYKKIEL